MIDYLFAAFIATAGTLGLMRLGGEVLSLHNETFQIMLAENALTEYRARSIWQGRRPVPGEALCTAADSAAASTPCAAFEAASPFLADAVLSAPDSLHLEIQWRLGDGRTTRLTQAW